MKEKIHPQYGEITVTFTNGEKVKMASTVKKDIILDVDPYSHPAWTGVRSNLERGGQVEKFKKKFAGLTSKK
jgi:large subunit ribosomal protein L31